MNGNQGKNCTHTSMHTRGSKSEHLNEEGFHVSCPDEEQLQKSHL